MVPDIQECRHNTFFYSGNFSQCSINFLSTFASPILSLLMMLAQANATNVLDIRAAYIISNITHKTGLWVHL